MIRLLDRVLGFFLGGVVESGVFMSMSDVKKSAGFNRPLDMRLLAHHIAHAENLHRVIRGMVN